MWGNPTPSENSKTAAEDFVEAGSAIRNDNDSRSYILTVKLLKKK